MKDKDIKNGQHMWALIDKKLVVVLKVSNGYTFCGEWDACVNFVSLEIIEFIEHPVNYEKTELYFND